MNTIKPPEQAKSALISISYKNIPEYLHCTTFYRALNSEDDTELDIPANCLWLGDVIRTDDDFRRYLQTQLFWGSSSITLDALQFCLQPSTESKSVYSAEHFYHCLGIIHDVFGNDSTLIRCLTFVIFSSEYKYASLSLYLISLLLRTDSCNRSHLQILFDFRAMTGEIGSLQSLVNSFGTHWDEVTCEHAARSGNFKHVEYLIDNGCPWDLGTCYFAAMHGRLEILRNVLNADTKPIAHKLYKWPAVAEAAAEFGHLDCLQFMYEHQFPWDGAACTAAAGRDDLTILEYLVDRGCPYSKDSLSNAVMKGSFENVQYLYEKGCPRIDEICVYAVRRRSCRVLQYLLESGCSLDKDVCSNAPTVETLRFIIDNGCPYPDKFLPTILPSLLIIDDFGDNLPYLQYTIEEMLLPMDELMFQSVLQYGRYTFVKYLIDSGCPFANAKPYASSTEEANTHIKDEEMCLSMIYAVEHGWNVNIECVQRMLDVEYVLCAQYFRAQALFPEITESQPFINLCTNNR